MTRDRGSSQDDTHVSPARPPTVICGIYKTVATMSVTLSSLGVLFSCQRTSLVFDALLKALVETEHRLRQAVREIGRATKNEANVPV